MEKKLKRLFDYQRFQKNSRLETMLSEAEARYENGISDDDLEWVSAAGNQDSILKVEYDMDAYQNR